MLRKKKNILLWIITYTLSFFSFAQLKTGFEGNLKMGFLMPHRDLMKHLPQENIIGGEISIIFQTTGTKEWHNAFNLPRFGFSSSFSSLGNKDILGYSAGLKTFMTHPLIRSKQFMIGIKPAVGISYLTKTFDLNSNLKNNAIGRHINSFVGIDIESRFKFQASEISLNIGMHHLSNGASQMPNLGLNKPMASFGYTYFIRQDYPQKETSIEELNFNRNLKISAIGIASVKERYPVGGQRHIVGSGSIFVSKQFSRKAIYEIAIEGFLNESNRKYLIPQNNNDRLKDIFQIGIYGGYVLPINRLNYYFGMGAYLLNPANPDGSIYHRMGIRIEIIKQLKFQLGIKSHWGKADYFEYGLIYDLWQN